MKKLYVDSLELSNSYTESNNNEETNMLPCNNTTTKLLGGAAKEQLLEKPYQVKTVVLNSSTSSTTTATIQPIKIAAANNIDKFKNDSDMNAGGAASTVTTIPTAATALTITQNNDDDINGEEKAESNENLSDTYYPNSLILLDDDEDEDDDDCISINSDDCIYAYRGNGDGFDLEFQNFSSRFADSNVDDETDYLEMDFEPDPSSEIEYGCSVDSTTMLPQKMGLQSQAILNKDLTIISLHLDKIQSDENDCNGRGVGGGDCGAVNHKLHHSSPAVSPTQELSQSYMMCGNYSCNTLDQKLAAENHLKSTGAKPKRLSAFPSISSKHSGSRASLRTNFVVNNEKSFISFDERCVSCTDFRSIPEDYRQIAQEDTVENKTCDNFDTIYNDEATCLDCLEKEFLANTIGKVIDSNDCSKCRRHRLANIALYTNAPAELTRKDSTSSIGQTHAEFLFEMISNEYTNSDFVTHNNLENIALDSKLNSDDIFNTSNDSKINHKFYKYSNEVLLKDVINEKEIVTISTINLSEEIISEALQRLDINYNKDLLNGHFKTKLNCRIFNDFRHFLLYHSKNNFNRNKLKRFLDFITNQQVNIQFEKDNKINEMEMVKIKTTDILQQWQHTKQLDSIKNMDNRFTKANILGKIANIIRLSQRQRSPIQSKCLYSEFLLIPQYYPSGTLTISRKY